MRTRTSLGLVGAIAAVAHVIVNTRRLENHRNKPRIHAEILAMHACRCACTHPSMTLGYLRSENERYLSLNQHAQASECKWHVQRTRLIRAVVTVAIVIVDVGCCSLALAVKAHKGVFGVLSRVCESKDSASTTALIWASIHFGLAPRGRVVLVAMAT